MVNVIPMSGRGARFSDIGYLLPKPLIPISGQPMIWRVIDSLPPTDKWIFIVRQEHIDNFQIDKLIKSKIPSAIIVAEEKPIGQASSVMLVMPYLGEDEDFLISACDSSFLFDKQKFNLLKKRPEVDTIVWTFTQDNLLTADPTAWGWLKLGVDGETIENVSVKIPVSADPYRDHAVVATFYFKKADDFKLAYEKMVQANYRTNGEFYIDTMPIFLKQLGKKSVIFDVDLYIGWGKPSDIYYYQLKEYDYRLKKLTGGTLDNLWDCFLSSLK